jgi:SAM-dependent methyltransferase
MQNRAYKDYQEYVDHQGLKADQILHDYRNVGKGPLRHSVFLSEFLALSEAEEMPPGKVLCLGARFGEEVRAWDDLGFDAIGIDLNPGPNNDYVVKGDFHNLQYKDNTWDYVWSNAIDHALYLERAVREAYRILKPKGKAIFEVKQHVVDSVKADDKWEAVFWESKQELLDFLENLNLWKSVRYLPLKFFILRAQQRTLLDRPCIVLEK